MRLEAGAAVTTEHWNTSFAFQDLEIEAQAELLESPDFIEAVTSHIENRQPKFVGE